MAWLNVESANKDSSNWAGALAIPRFLFVYKNTDEWQLGQETAFVESLRTPLTFSKKFTFKQKHEHLIKAVDSRHYNAVATYSSDTLISKEFGFKVVATDTFSMNINIKNGYLNVAGRKPCKLDIDETTTELCLEVYLDGASLEIFVSKNIGNGAMVGFATYSAQLSTLKDTKENAYVYSDNGVDVDLEIYNMQSCWVSAPKGE